MDLEQAIRERDRLADTLYQIAWECHEPSTKAAIGKARGLARAALAGRLNQQEASLRWHRAQAKGNES